MSFEFYIIYTFITRASIIFIFTMMYLVLCKINRFDENKFKDAFKMAFVLFEITAPLSILYCIGSLVAKITSSMLGIIYKFIIKKNGGEKNV